MYPFHLTPASTKTCNLLYILCNENMYSWQGLPFRFCEGVQGDMSQILDQKVWTPTCMNRKPFVVGWNQKMGLALNKAHWHFLCIHYAVHFLTNRKMTLEKRIQIFVLCKQSKTKVICCTTFKETTTNTSCHIHVSSFLLQIYSFKSVKKKWSEGDLLLKIYCSEK